MCSGWEPVFPLRYDHREFVFFLHLQNYTVRIDFGQALDLLVSVGSRPYDPYTSDLSTE